MKVKQLIKKLKKMPQNAEVGWEAHDYSLGDSDAIDHVAYIGDEKPDNDAKAINYPVVLSS